MKQELKELMGNLHEIMKFIHQRSYYKSNNKHMYPGQPKLLSIIMANEGITQRELAAKNCVTPATITGMLTKLEHNHFIYRTPDESDKRILRVYLTPEGRNLAEHAEDFMIALIEQLFEGFSDEELHTLLELSKKLQSNVHNHEK